MVRLTHDLPKLLDRGNRSDGHDDSRGDKKRGDGRVGMSNPLER